MGLKTYKPITPGRRQRVSPDFYEITKKKPEKSLLKKLVKKAGRSKGRISVRRRGGGAKRRLRVVDFKRQKLNIPAKVKAVEYDPNRTARVALIQYKDGQKCYILASSELKVGDEIVTSEKASQKPGNRMKLKNIIPGTFIYNIELTPGKGGQIVRAAGNSAVLLATEEKYATVQLPSKEIRKIPAESYASIGSLSHPEHKAEKLGKAGRKRWLGKRPKVRGKAMHPAAHPHGGGEGQSPIGMPTPKTPWGKPTLGKKTRKKKLSDKLIIKRRK